MSCITKNDMIDSILQSYKTELGNDFEQYRNHVYRVYNFAVPLVSSDQDAKTLSIAAAFHDLGIWTNKTFDYLEPSVHMAKQFSEANGLDSATIYEIETIIYFHHKISGIKSSSLAEIFRQADLTDLSLGFIRCGRTPKNIKMIRNTFPNKGFHLNLTRLFIKNLFKNPLKPLPMYKF